MKKIKIGKREYNVSNMIDMHIKGLESGYRVLKAEVYSKDKLIEKLNKELEGKDILIKIKTERIQKLMRRLEKRQEKVDKLEREKLELFNTSIEQVIKIRDSKDEEIEKLERENKIMKKYLQLIIDLGFDYDGFNESEDLKKLIDELVRYAVLGRDVNDKEVMYVKDLDDKGRYNILMEKINENKVE